VLSLAATVPLALQLYALVQLGAGASLAAVWQHAVRRQHVPPDADPLWRRYHNLTLTARPILFAASIGVAVVSVSLAYAVWAAALVVQAVARRRPLASQPRRPTAVAARRQVAGDLPDMSEDARPR
jgi:hypothetical protein